MAEPKVIRNQLDPLYTARHGDPPAPSDTYTTCPAAGLEIAAVFAVFAEGSLKRF